MVVAALSSGSVAQTGHDTDGVWTTPATPCRVLGRRPWCMPILRHCGGRSDPDVGRSRRGERPAGPGSGPAVLGSVVAVPTWVSLLRAVNLGSRNKVPMAALRSALADAGFQDVRTYVASGNVITRSGHRSPDRVAAEVRRVVAQLTGLEVPVMVRSPDDIDAVIAANPWPEATKQRPELVAVSFLAATPDADRVAALRAEDFGDEACRVIGREVYVDHANSVHASRLTPAFLTRRLGVDGTARNWRTVEALAQMCR